MWDPVSVAFLFIEDDVVFNPVVDDAIRGNRSNKTVYFGGSGYFVWVHAEILDNSQSEVFHGQTRNDWNLEEAVRSICSLLNPNQDYIKNPTISTSVLLTAPDIRDLQIKIGTRLPEALDTMLIPLGFNWFIDYDLNKPQIVIFEIGVGPEKELKFQATGNILDLELSNVNQFETTNTIGDSFNEVLALGEFEEAELTIPLYCGFDDPGYAAIAEDYAKDGDQYVGNETVWRLFIANEGGDLDPAIERCGVLPLVPALDTVFSTALPHRRVLGEPLTYLTGDIPRVPSPTIARPQPRPIFLEWSDDAGYTWKPEDPKWTVKLCPDQIGILFDGKEVPGELFAAGDDLRMRITGTVFGDARLQGFAGKQLHSANGRTFRQVLDVPDKFQKRWRQEDGDYASELAAGGHPAAERDDTAEILAYAENLRNKNENAELDCEFRLPGWHVEYEIGDLITKIAGREISLDAAASGAPSNRYVQIVERIFELSKESGPATILVVDRGVSA